jgi:hypothetical protein
MAIELLVRIGPPLTHAVLLYLEADRKQYESLKTEVKRLE